MVSLLGIDYGTKNIGLSLTSTPIAEPFTILPNNSKLLAKLQSICQKHQISRIILGISEGVMAQKSQAFGEQLKKSLKIPIEFHDETLSSHQAKQFLQHAKKILRNKPQDAYQATVMLQDYLDTQVDRPLNKV